MYRAKALGKAGFVVFDDAMHASTVSRLRMESDFARRRNVGIFSSITSRSCRCEPVRSEALNRCCAGTTPIVVWFAPTTSSR